MNTCDDIASLAAEYGLTLRGVLAPQTDDELPLLANGATGKALLLFGNLGAAMWPVFSASPEYQDGDDDPLDRWSQRIGLAMADVLQGRALFPFGGPPFLPFSRWAARAEALRASPIGMLLHPQAGLWHAYRFAILLPEPPLDGVPVAEAAADICARCVEQPCLSACPVDAFGVEGYDVEACYRWLRANEPDGDCHVAGCLARGACPVGEGYSTAQTQFHMSRFYQSLCKRFSDPGSRSIHQS